MEVTGAPSAAAVSGSVNNYFLSLVQGAEGSMGAHTASAWKNLGPHRECGQAEGRTQKALGSFWNTNSFYLLSIPQTGKEKHEQLIGTHCVHRHLLGTLYAPAYSNLLIFMWETMCFFQNMCFKLRKLGLQPWPCHFLPRRLCDLKFFIHKMGGHSICLLGLPGGVNTGRFFIICLTREAQLGSIFKSCASSPHDTAKC